MCCQRAPSATPGLIAKLVGAGKYDPTASKSLGVLPVISVREQDDFYRWSEIKAPQLARGVEAEVFFFFVGQRQKVVVGFFCGYSFLVMVSLVYCSCSITLHAGHGMATNVFWSSSTLTLQHPSHSSNEIKQQLASQGGGAGVAVGKSTLSLTLPNLPSHPHRTDGITKAAVSTELSGHVHAAKTCMPSAGEGYTTL